MRGGGRIPTFLAFARRGWELAVIAALIVLAAGWQIAAALLASPEWIGSYLTHDDTYLALQVARGWAAHGFPTFDGIHPTNGFQPLWGLLLAGLARCFDDPIALLRATLAFAALLNTLTALVLYRICRALRPEAAALAVTTVALWCAYSVSGKPALIALENALLPTIAAATLLVTIALRRDPAKLSRWIVFGTLLAALAWTRLDALVLIVGVLAITFRVAQRRKVGLPIVGAILLAAAAGYVAFERAAGGTNTPVSGLVKRAIVEQGQQSVSLASIAAAVRDGGNIVLKQAAIGIGLIRPQAASSVGRIAVLLLLVWALVRVRSNATGWVALAGLILLAHALAVRLWLSEYFHDTPWYYAATNLLAGLGVAILLFECVPPAWHCRVAAAAILVFMLRLAGSCWLLTQPPPREAAAPVRIAAAAWLHANVPAGQRAAAWNAGELAYFSGVTLINLDGLVNDAAFYREVVRGQTSLDEYLKSQGVDWVADYAAGAEEGARLWDTLPGDEWTIVARVGEHPEARQLIARRRIPLAGSRE